MAENISNQLFEALKQAVDGGWSLNQIAKAAGVPQPTLHRYYSGDRKSLSLKTIVALCNHFEMRLTKPKIGPPPSDVQEPRRKPKAKEARKK